MQPNATPNVPIEPLECRLCLSAAHHHAAKPAHKHHHHSSAGNIGVVQPAVSTRTVITTVDSSIVADRIAFTNSSLFANSSLFGNNVGMIPPIAGDPFFTFPLTSATPPATVLVPPIAGVTVPPVFSNVPIFGVSM
jgi:hypothetical protein